MEIKELVSNRKAFHNYEILDTFEAGVILLGTEIKSLRANQGSLSEAYILVSDGEAILKNSSIPPYKFGSVYNHEEKRSRKLLLHKMELKKLKIASNEKGLTIIPLSLYLKDGLAKIKIAIARGKHEYDKRQALKEKSAKRSIERILKS